MLVNLTTLKRTVNKKGPKVNLKMTVKDLQVISCLNFWDEAWWFLSLRVFGLLSSFLFLFPPKHGGNNNKDEDNSPKTLNNKSRQINPEKDCEAEKAGLPLIKGQTAALLLDCWNEVFGCLKLVPVKGTPLIGQNCCIGC